LASKIFNTFDLSPDYLIANCASENDINFWLEHNITVIFKNAEILAFPIDLPLLCHTHAIGMP
jgi:hypothetical protein